MTQVPRGRQRSHADTSVVPRRFKQESQAAEKFLLVRCSGRAGLQASVQATYSENLSRLQPAAHQSYDQFFSSLFSRAGRFKQESRVYTSGFLRQHFSVCLRTLPPLRGSGKNSHLTQDSATLRPGLTALPPLRGWIFANRIPLPRSQHSSHANSEVLP